MLKSPVDTLNAGLADDKRYTKWTHQCQISFIVKKEYNFLIWRSFNHLKND